MTTFALALFSVPTSEAFSPLRTDSCKPSSVKTRISLDRPDRRFGAFMGSVCATKAQLAALAN